MIVLDQVIDEEAEKLGSPADACLAVYGVRLGFDRAFGDAAQSGHVLGREALDCEQRDIALCRCQVSLSEAFFKHVLEGGSCDAQRLFGRG